MQEVWKEAQESLEDTASSQGLDPKADGLDYGDEENETFAVRLKKLNKSIVKVRKAEDDAGLESVRGTAPMATRDKGGSAPEQKTGDSLLRTGSNSIWERIQTERKSAPKNRGKKI